MAERTALPGYEAIQVLGARLIVRPVKESDTTASGIVITGAKEPKYEGVIVATGPGARLETGVQMPMECHAGQNVIYSRLAGVPVEHNGEDLLIINERDIICIIEKPAE